MKLDIFTFFLISNQNGHKHAEKFDFDQQTDFVEKQPLLVEIHNIHSFKIFGQGGEEILPYRSFLINQII